MSILGRDELIARYAEVLGQEVLVTLPALAGKIIVDIKQRYIETGENKGELSLKADTPLNLVSTPERQEALSDALRTFVYEITQERIRLRFTRCKGRPILYTYEVDLPSVYT